MSESIKLHSGVPQGGIISPLLYIIYVADLQLWLKHSKVTSYADDTKTCVSHGLLTKVIEMLEEDAKNVLMSMASNGLVANPQKTAFMVLNYKQKKSKKNTEKQKKKGLPDFKCYNTMNTDLGHVT